MEVCPTMKKWMADLVVMKRLSENKPKRTVFMDRSKCCLEIPFNNMATYLHPPRVWMPPPLAELQEEYPEDKQRLISIWKNGSGGKSLEEFVTDQRRRGCCYTECESFAGTDDDRIICFYYVATARLLIWNISTFRVVACLQMNEHIYKVEAGWDGRGLCVTLSDRVICYDSEGRLVDNFILPADCQHEDTLLMRSISVVLVTVRRNGEKWVVMEFERGQRSVRFGFEIDILPVVLQVILLGGPAYPVVVISTENATLIYIRLVSPCGVCKWHKITTDYYPINEYLKLIQFINGTSYILPSEGDIMWKVIMQKDKDRNELVPDLIVERHVDVPLRHYIVWVDSYSTSTKS